MATSTSSTTTTTTPPPILFLSTSTTHTTTSPWKLRNETLLTNLDALLQFKSKSDIKLDTYRHHLHALKTIYSTNLTTYLFSLKLKNETQPTTSSNVNSTATHPDDVNALPKIQTNGFSMLSSTLTPHAKVSPTTSCSLPLHVTKAFDLEEEEEEEEEEVIIKRTIEEDGISQTDLDMSDGNIDDAPMLMGTFQFNSEEFLHLQNKLSNVIRKNEKQQQQKNEKHENK
ncbi:hypothetical protein HMI54_009372 [Coelomomyces lativittatus]|nr:hypothetical protein HMI56_000665 [Coelomomyces lativittatus]KAJ1508872.1 hypothetical protein HMI55_000188 [Coelomomyces lativittatus]KAJ1516441.1 hypothetical protein HMI54_009372 [Coelomomyces lativittatus]